MRGRNKKKMFRDVFDFDESDDDGPVLGVSPAASSMRSFSGSTSSHAAAPATIREIPVKARSELQARYLAAMEGGAGTSPAGSAGGTGSQSPTIVVATGAAGTGKTMLACCVAMSALAREDYAKLVITRPVVAVDDSEGIGFLPGSLFDKMRNWTAPLLDVFYKSVTPKAFATLMEKQVIEICPLEMMRGRSFEDAFIIVDEAQNCSPTQMLMLLTRIGRGSKLVITGDPRQHDRPRAVNGLADFLARLEQRPSPDIAVFQFTEEHIERHPILRHVLKMYEVEYKKTGGA
jgi:phosphate starvation-inducible PhoH-like protein